MNDEAFEASVLSWFEQLPEWVQEALSNVSIQVHAHPRDVLEGEPEAEDAELLGLYLGLPLPEQEANPSGEPAAVIYLFREAHLALGLDGEALHEEIGRTLLHEVAHHFGFDDDWLADQGFA